MIVVVDYHKGNLKSVERGLIAAGAQASISDDPAVIAAADGIVLPGVGSFADAADDMMRTGQMDAIRAAVDAGAPFLGICLGMHLMFADGTEGARALRGEDTLPGLGLIPGTVDALPRTDADGNTFKVPHVGWNSIEFTAENGGPLFEGVKPGEYFYFTHSFVSPASTSTIATTRHSVVFPSAVAYSDRVFGVQFHPEKSSDAGALVLRNFARIVDTCAR